MSRGLGDVYKRQVYMYQQSFEFYNTGYGAAMAWVMLLMIGLITLFLFATKRFWVYEGGL